MDMRSRRVETEQIGGIRMLDTRVRSCGSVADFFADLHHLSAGRWRARRMADGGSRYTLTRDSWQELMPGFDTSHLRGALAWSGATREQLVEQEILLTMLGGPVPLVFADLQALAAYVRVQRNICLAAEKTAVAFKTLAAERPKAYWDYREDDGFVLREGANLVEALKASTQPAVTGAVYDFSCYRASEYVMLLGLAQELSEHDPAALETLEERCRRKAIRSREFHDLLLDEFGTMEEPIPARYFVPGDRLWFRNPDARSSDALGYEGSWVIYLGAGLFSNFWERDRPFTLLDKCLEIYHWRDGAFQDSEGQWQMDEEQVRACVARTRADEEAMSQVLARMMRMRDPQGVYADGGCLDSTRERVKGTWNRVWCGMQAPALQF